MLSHSYLTRGFQFVLRKSQVQEINVSNWEYLFILIGNSFFFILNEVFIDCYPVFCCLNNYIALHYAIFFSLLLPIFLRTILNDFIVFISIKLINQIL